MKKLFVCFVMLLSFLIIGCDSSITKIKISSSSMEPDFKKGEVYDFEKTDPATLKVGDVIAYEMVEGYIVVSRIARIDEDTNGVYFIVKSTQNSQESMDRIRYENVIGVYRG